MASCTAPKGTFDILPTPATPAEEWKRSHLWSYLERVMVDLARTYAFCEIRTPIFEQASLFIRSVGETSDIVSKEMYTFQDKGNRALCLRPEGTAAVMRAFVQHQLQQHGTKHKFFYKGPFFRYDRPQAGRYRQFHQFGVEAIGEDTPQQDFEVISLLVEIYRQLGLGDLRLQLNTLGSHACRARYTKALLEFLTPHTDRLTPDSQRRLHANPLRILDSKDPNEQALLERAPRLIDVIDGASRQRFEALCSLLTKANLPFEVTPTLVRGLDYYNHVVFEVVSDQLGAQNALGGGGRYNGLLASFGGPDLPSVGFSLGIERTLIALLEARCCLPPPPAPLVSLIPLGPAAHTACFDLLYTLRRQGVCTELIDAKTVQKALQKAAKLNATFALVLGDHEIAKQTAQVKIMKTRETKEVAFGNLTSFFLNPPGA